MKEEPLQDVSRLQLLISFLKATTSSSSLLLLATVAALVWANSRYAYAYHDLWNMQLTIQLGHLVYGMSLHHWVNDALMAVFFFVVGLEIKREFLVGELSSRKKAIFPMIAALGGMLVPALIYLSLNYGTNAEAGWGIPMATDIAFALGCLAVLGNRVPFQLKVFLLALAIFDDIGSIIVIAVFYTPDLALQPLFMAAAVLALAFGLNLIGVRRTMPYAVLGLILWVLMARSGIHATVAGILLALAIPARANITAPEFSEAVSHALESFPERGQEIMYTADQDRQSFKQIDESMHRIKAPLQDLEEVLQPVAMVLIIPLFALANAGITIETGFSGLIASPVTIGIILGLVIGKQIGISFFSWAAVRLGIASLPSGVSMAHIYGISCIAGIGYTMSIFIANLAFPDGSYADAAKAGILLASMIAVVLGLSVLGLATRNKS